MAGYPNYLVIVLALIGAVIACGCMAAGGDETPADRISGNGTVTYIDLEGGFYGIVADDGERYLPPTSRRSTGSTVSGFGLPLTSRTTSRPSSSGGRRSIL